MPEIALPEIAPESEAYSSRRLADARAKVTAAVATITTVCCAIFSVICVYFEQPSLIIAVNGACALVCGVLWGRALRGYRASTDRAVAIAVMCTLLGNVLIETQIATLLLYVPVAVYVLCAEPSPRWRSWLLTATCAQVVAVLIYIGAAGPERLLDPRHVEIETAHAVIVGLVTAIMICLYRRLGAHVRRASTDYAARLRLSVAASRASAGEMAASMEALRTTNAELAASVAQHRRVQAELAATHEQLEQFGNAASHDLKEPLRTIRAFSQLLQREAFEGNGDRGAAAVVGGTPDRRSPNETPVEDEVALREDFAYVDNAAASMQVLLEKLLVYQRASAAQEGGLALEKVDVGRLWREVVAGEGELGGVRVTYSSDAEAPVVLAREQYLRVALRELVRNGLLFHGAAAATDKRLACDIRSVVDGGGGDGGADGGRRLLEVRIADNGIGVAPAYRERVFGMFKRLHAREVYPGAGLGLPLVRRVVEGVGGSVRLEGSALGGGEGSGTTVVVRLRACPPPA